MNLTKVSSFMWMGPRLVVLINLVGVLTFNIHGKTSIARRSLSENALSSRLDDLAKLFELYEE